MSSFRFVALVSGVVSGLLLSACSNPPLPSDEVTISVKDDQAQCDPENPLLVVMKNVSDRRLIEVEYDIKGREPGHSDIIQTSGQLRSDLILNPGDEAQACHQIINDLTGRMNTNNIDYSAYVRSVR